MDHAWPNALRCLGNTRGRRSRKMIWIAVVFLTIVLLGGVGRLLMFQRGPAAQLPESERLLTRKKLLALGIVGIASGSLGLVFLYLGILGPVAAIVGALLLVSVIELAMRGKTINLTS